VRVVRGPRAHRVDQGVAARQKAAAEAVDRPFLAAVAEAEVRRPTLEAAAVVEVRRPFLAAAVVAVRRPFPAGAAAVEDRHRRVEDRRWCTCPAAGAVACPD
jgi:hypothetical protein